MFRSLRPFLLSCFITLAAQAQDTLIAGFNFGQFNGSGVPCTDGVDFNPAGSVAAGFRGVLAPKETDSGVYRANNGIPGAYDPGYATWYWDGTNGSASFGYNGVDIVVYEGGLNAVNAAAPGGGSLLVADTNFAGLAFSVAGQKWSIVANTLGYSDTTTAANFSFAAFASGGAATIEWLLDGSDTPFATTVVAAGTEYAAYSVDLPSGFYGKASVGLQGRLASAGRVTFDNVQINGSLAQAPIFTQQPVSQSVTAGATVSFSVVVSGAASPTYQWRRNNVALVNGPGVSGAGTATLTLAGVALSQAGNYTVVVNNNGIAAESAAGVLTVNQVPAITQQPVGATVVVGGSATFVASASGVPAPAYRWRKDGVDLDDGADIAGSSTDTLHVTPSALSAAGSYTVVATNAAGSVESSAAVLVVNQAPSITLQPASVAALAGDPVSFSVTASGTPAPTYEWRRNGSALVNGAGIVGANTATLTISAASPALAGTYTVLVANAAGSVLSSGAVLAVNQAPSITQQPSSVTAGEGGSATLTVVASGNPAPAYQWRKGGVPLANGNGLSGVSTATLVFTDLELAAAGDYAVFVSNSVGDVLSSTAILTVVAENVAPTITRQPVAVSALLGASAAFSVSASGAPAPTYQWRKDGAPIDGATGPDLVVSPVSSASEGSYTVVVTNAAGSVESSAAALTVNAAPTITAQPADATVLLGADATFGVTAEGNPVPTYAWRKDGLSLVDGPGVVGAATATLRITASALSAAGSYTVRVTNAEGSVESSAAVLVVNQAPVITRQPSAVTVLVDEAATLAVEAEGSPAPAYQWRRNGVPVASAVAARLTIDPAALASAGDYTVVVSNVAGSVESAVATLTVNAAPVITRQPETVAVGAGAPLVLSVVATGHPAPAYQWKKGDEPVSGATSATLAFDAAAPADAGDYTVLVTNEFGSVVSQVATVGIGVAPAIVTPPAARSVAGGARVEFRVVATGAPAPAYQWLKDGEEIEGADAATFVIAAASPADEARYSVRVSNSYGSVVSEDAALTVAQPVALDKPAKAQVFAPGSLLSLGEDRPVGAVRYQWFRDGRAIAGATGPFYVIPAAAFGDSGVYSIKIYSSAGRLLGSRVVATVRISVAGAYDTLLRDPDSLAPLARLAVDIADKGAVTGRLACADGRRYALKGALSFPSAAYLGAARIVVKRTGGLPALELDLSLDARTGEFDAALSPPGEDAPDGVGLGRSRLSGSAPWKGTYALALTPIAPVPDGQPSAVATLKVVVNARGVMAFTGRLADGVKVTGSFPSSVDRAYAVFLQPYKPGGQMAGDLVLVPEGDKFRADLESGGKFFWAKPAAAGAVIDLTLAPALRSQP